MKKFYNMLFFVYRSVLTTPSLEALVPKDLVPQQSQILMGCPGYSCLTFTAMNVTLLTVCLQLEEYSALTFKSQFIDSHR